MLQCCFITPERLRKIRLCLSPPSYQLVPELAAGCEPYVRPARRIQSFTFHRGFFTSLLLFDSNQLTECRRRDTQFIGFRVPRRHIWTPGYCKRVLIYTSYKGCSVDSVIILFILGASNFKKKINLQCICLQLLYCSDLIKNAIKDSVNLPGVSSFVQLRDREDVAATAPPVRYEERRRRFVEEFNLICSQQIWTAISVRQLVAAEVSRQVSNGFLN